MELTAVELALITPVKGYGYCFSYIGGAQMNLKGKMMFMKVPAERIMSGTGQLAVMGLKNTVVILLSGSMTPNQKRSATLRVRVDKITEAMTWLCTYPKNWKSYDVRACMHYFSNMVPKVVDRSKEAASVEDEVETTQVFSCYFPDGTMDEYRGGFKNIDKFREFVETMKQRDYEFSVRVDLARECSERCWKTC
jgi:hypothetical protein